MLSWFVRLLSLAALASFASAVWFLGPMIGFGDTRPLEPAWVRGAVAGGVVMAVALFYAVAFWQKRRAQMALELVIAESEADGSDGAILKSRMNEAIATLKRTARKRNFLYDLPWYIVIGPPGAGKTTALVESGLSFPLAGSGRAQPVSGVGGTRYCDWWFTEEAVLIDTAGRYTTQESDPGADKKSWLAFLALLRRYRGRQPINGAILAISLADLMLQDGSASTALAVEIRNRLRELRDELGIDFPVYLLFTKADLIVGFMEYFGDFDEQRRRNVWGATFQVDSQYANPLGQLPAAFDGLSQRLGAEMTDRLQEETDQRTRITVFDFPDQFGRLKSKVIDFVGRVFGAEGHQQGARLRGFYFSSGTQEGTPIDQVLGALARNLGGDASRHLSGGGKSFFLHDLLSNVIFAESAWVSSDRKREKQAALLRYGGMAAIGLAAAAAIGMFAVSFVNNRQLIAATSLAADQYRDMAGDLLMANAVADADLENVIGPLDALRSLPVGYDNREVAVPLGEALGYAQRPRLVSAAAIAYGRALERMFRSRLLLQVEDAVMTNMSNPTALYEPLRVYLTLGGQAPRADTERIVAWLRNDWEKVRYPGSQNRAGREELEKHLRAMLELGGAQDPQISLNRQLVESAQRSLGRMTVADRAAALIQSSAASAGLEDFSLAEQAGPEASLVFETTDGSDIKKLRVPALYTHKGFNEFFLTQLSTVAQKVTDDQWVIGAGGQLGGVEQELMRLGPELLDRYAKDFGAAWNGLLDKLRLKPLAADKPQYVALAAAGSSTSPIRLLFEKVAAETELTRPTDVAGLSPGEMDDRSKGLARIGIILASGKSQSRAGAAFANASETVPGAGSAAQFRPYHVLVSGPPGRRPLDALVQNLNDIHESLSLAQEMSGQGERVAANLQLQISNLRANASRLPKALSRMVLATADDFEGDAAETSIAQLNLTLAETVTAPCQEAVTDRYPFVGSGSADMSMEDFARIFAPNGVIDRFFAQNLSPLVTMGGTNWDWRQDSQLGKKLSKSTLRRFQQAAEIRDAFFPMGGSIPAVNITFTPFSLNSDADQALLDINGQIVQSYQSGSTAATVTWPGGLNGGSTALSLTPEMPGRDSALQYDGPWGLKRLFNAGSFSKDADKLQVRFVIGGRDVAYTVQFSSIGNPFGLPALSEFTCPEKL